MDPSYDQEIRYRLFKVLSQESSLSQREIARRVGISLGKVNYCLSDFTQKGFIKVKNFKASKNKTRYLYMLTPKGIEEKMRLTLRFFKRKLKEYDELKHQINELRQEIESGDLHGRLPSESVRSFEPLK